MLEYINNTNRHNRHNIPMCLIHYNKDIAVTNNVNKYIIYSLYLRGMVYGNVLC